MLPRRQRAHRQQAHRRAPQATRRHRRPATQVARTHTRTRKPGRTDPRTRTSRLASINPARTVPLRRRTRRPPTQPQRRIRRVATKGRMRPAQPSGHAVEREHRGSRQQSGCGRRREPVEPRGRECGGGRRRRSRRSGNGDCDSRPAVADERQRLGPDREPGQWRSGQSDEHRHGRGSETRRAPTAARHRRRPTRRPTSRTRRTSTSRSANARLRVRRRAPGRPDLRSRLLRKPVVLPPLQRALRRRRLRRPTRRT